MSNIYIQEPPALGKVLLKTTVGDIDLELWTKEAPKACRNFIQLCMEGYYNDTIFHRVVPNFIVQGGDPNGDGTGGESVYGSTFKDEFHSRLRFNRRGLVAMANAGKDDNGSQFFFTLNATPELQNKHTIFAKVTGETIFNMIKLTEGETDGDDRPFYPNKITSTEVLVNPFEDIVPRQTTGSVVDEEYLEKKIKKENDKGVKNFGLLSFGMEAEEDEDKSEVFRGKPKSTHDLLNDPKLSKLTVKEELATVSKQPSKETEEAAKAAVRSIKRKLQATVNSIRGKLERSMKEREVSNSVKVEKSEEVEEEYYLGKDRIEARKKQAEEIRGQIKNLKREMSDKKNKDRTVEDERGDAKKFKEEKSEDKNELVKQYEEEQDKYRKMKDKLPKKKESREEFTLSLLRKFQNKLSSAKEKVQVKEEQEESGTSHMEDIKPSPASGDDDLDELNGDDWLTHKLHFETKGSVLAKDASTKGDDWFDIYDPRNPLNKRKREQSKTALASRAQMKLP